MLRQQPCDAARPWECCDCKFFDSKAHSVRVSVVDSSGSESAVSVLTKTLMSSDCFGAFYSIATEDALQLRSHAASAKARNLMSAKSAQRTVGSSEDESAGERHLRRKSTLHHPDHPTALPYYLALLYSAATSLFRLISNSAASPIKSTVLKRIRWPWIIMSSSTDPPVCGCSSIPSELMLAGSSGRS